MIYFRKTFNGMILLFEINKHIMYQVYAGQSIATNLNKTFLLEDAAQRFSGNKIRREK